MSKQNETKKPIPSLNEWIKSQYINNLIKVITGVLIMAGLVFWIVGDALNGIVGVMQWFLLMFFTMQPLIVLNDVIMDSQLGYLQGKWKEKAGEVPHDPGFPKNHWSRIALAPLIYGAIAGGIGYLVFWFYIVIGDSALFPLSATAIMFLTAIIIFFPCWLITHFWVKRHLSDEMASLIGALSRPKQEQPEPFSRYFLWEHALPWMIILGILNLGINLKGFSENLLADGVILVWDIAWSIWITALVLIIWMFLSANSQVRADVHLKRVGEGRQKSLPLLIALFLLIPIAAGGLVFLFSIIFAVSEYAVIPCTVFVIIDAMVVGAIGRYLGIWWGKADEFAKLK